MLATDMNYTTISLKRENTFQFPGKYVQKLAMDSASIAPQLGDPRTLVKPIPL